MQNTRLRWLGRHLGGPFNLVLIPAIGAAAGLVISLLIFLPLGWLAENSNLRRWWRTMGLVLSVIIAIVILAWVAFGATRLQNRAYLFVGVVATYVVSDGCDPSTAKQINSLFVQLFAFNSAAITKESTSTSSSPFGRCVFSLGTKPKTEQ